jgi:hypothetical protein
MKLNELAPEPISTVQYTIACDMDGVICDFLHLANKITGMQMQEGDLDVADKGLKNEFWKRVINYVKTGQEFFGAMQPMPDAHVLWNYISRHPHFILTAAGTRIPNADPEKRAWIARHFSPTVRVEVVDSAKAKSRFATPTTILIDDRAKAIDPWIVAGGIGILHTSAASTIAQLKKLGL